MLLSSFSIHDEIEDSHDFRSDLDKDPAGLIHSRRLSYRLKSISFEPSHSSRLVCPSTIAISASSEVGDVNSMNHLWDLLSALESIREGSNPSVGLSHKLSGWLAQPLEKWPNFTLEMIMDGDIDV